MIQSMASPRYGGIAQEAIAVDIVPVSVTSLWLLWWSLSHANPSGELRVAPRWALARAKTTIVSSV